MNGLLDGFSLPGADTPQGQGLLAAAFNLMGARGNSLGNAIGDAGRTYMGAYGQAKQTAAQDEVRRLEIDKFKRDAEQERYKFDQTKRLQDLAKSFYRSPQAANAMSQGPMPDGGNMPEIKSGFDSTGYANALYQEDPMQAMAFEQSMQKDDVPIKLSAGEQLYSGKASGYKPILSIPNKDSAKSAEIQAYEYAKSQGYQGTFDQWDLVRKRASSATTTINMSDGQKGFDNEMKLGNAFKQEPIYKDHAAVQSAFSQINAALSQGTPISDTAAATKIMKILDPGSVVRETELGMAMAAGEGVPNFV